MPRLAPARTLATLWLVAALVSPHWVSPDFSQAAPTCCQGDCSCCRRAQAPGPKFSSRPSCPERCGFNPLGFGHPAGVVALAAQVWPAESRACASQSDLTSPPHTSYPAFLYQRPPPAA